MKKAIGCIFMLLIAGCSTTTTQMINNQFFELPLTTPEYAGVYTGVIGGAISTIKINKDGNGLMCEDNGYNANVFKIKNSNNLLIAQNGVQFVKINFNDHELITKTTSVAFNVTTKYQADANLTLTSPRCAKELI